ncbi:MULTISPECIES: DUF7426 family protein [Bacteria]|uniref:DUF7426 domain-containing protein n=3 Tax=Bacteria TaxID=2 RepID=A0A1I4UKV5_9BURK|nr:MULTISPECIES: hypothetical protein [Bacteria]RKT85599.1 hypothetical protein ATL45_3946 [Saccharopolyspora antimicrobica]SFE68144.1 hypothetical protein SAMN05216506_113142 [Saccharopolyspora kobensis]SFM89555.1 hypothetical protein SAMN02982985_05704 [Rugamonas rubra]SFO86645.1 hypothetical protein SAMN05421805_12798 [Saccharopolyspora antimicrobica]
MALQDLGEFLDPTLSVPIRGKTYRVEPPDAETGLRLQHLSDWMLGAAAAVQADADAPAPSEELLSDAAELDMYRAALGAVYDELFADAVPWPWIKLAGMTAFLHWTVGAEQAEAYWAAGGRPEPQAGNRAQRRAARSTPRPGSPSGTSRSRKAARATAGGKSSATGS